MNSMDWTAVELGRKIKAKEISVEQAAKDALEQIRQSEKVYNCYVTVDEEGALAQAKKVQALIDDGALAGPLAGVPVAIPSGRPCCRR